nr:hypothetical protein [Tanacetum cinerariifolium]
MSDVSSVVTYTSVYMDSKPWRYYGDDSAEAGPQRVIVYEYDGLPIQPVAPPSPDYVPGPEHPPSLDYVPGPEHPPSPIEIPYVPEPEYPEHLAPSDDEAPLEDQPLPADASPIAASPNYVAHSDPEEDPKEDPEDDQADYSADGGMEVEEYLAPADSSIVPILDHVLPARETEALEADEPTHAPGSPISIPLSQTRLRRARKTVKPELPMAAEIRMRALLPSTSHGTDIPEADMPPQNRACLTTPTLRFEIGESSAAGAARQPGPTKSDLRRCRVEDRPDHNRIAMLMDREAMYSHETWAFSMDRSSAIAAHVRTLEIQVAALITQNTSSAIAAYVRTLETQVAALITQTTSLQTQLTTVLGRIEKMAPKKRTTRATPATATTPTTTITNAQLQALIDRGIAAALAERDADKSRNGDNGNDSGTDGRRQMTTPRECSYTDFLKKRLDMVELSHEGCCTGRFLCNAMGSFKKNDHRQVLPKGMFPEESAKVESYIGGLPDMIHGSVKALKPPLMQEAIEFAIEMMDKKMLTHAECQAEHKRKFDDTLRNTQHQ